jgi:hypothetical protein
MQFTYQALTWGFLIALIPLLIHLINMMRHRRVKWAAMEFLLQSYKKHRTWVWLKQLLLLLMRMAVIAMIVALLAQWDPQSTWLSRFGGKVTHHYLLIDDSYSMSDTAGEKSAFEMASQVVARIGSQAKQQGQHRFTLLRFSRANQGTGSSADEMLDHLDSIVDLNAEFVGTDFDKLLEEKRATFDVTEFSVDPLPSLQLVRQLVSRANKENSVVYVISDFRQADWETPSELRNSLQKIEQHSEQIHLVKCATAAHANLAITHLAPTDDTRAAGVPLFINVRIRNYGPEAVQKVQVKLRTLFHQDGKLEGIEAEELTGQEDRLPTMLIDNIAAGETISEKFQVYFPEAGQHVVHASLPSDAVDADNDRWTVIDFPDGDPVLIIGGSPGKEHQYYLSSIFQPSQRANTGIRPQLEEVQFLRDTPLESLNRFSAIYLLDVGRLDPSALEKIESFVRRGGGLGFFLGDNVDVAHYNEKLYRGGEGVLPVKLAHQMFLEPPFDSNTPDIEIQDHPIFDFFLGERNPLIRRVSIEQFIPPDANWEPAQHPTVKVVTRLHTGQPLVVERRFGEGRVVCFLTTAAPTWNNWATDPSFVVVALKLHAYLTAIGRVDEVRLVGQPFSVPLAVDLFLDKVKFFQPAESASLRVELERTAQQPGESSPLMIAALGLSGDASPRREETGRSGVYEAVYRRVDGKIEVSRFALNVDGAEGNLAIIDDNSLMAGLKPVTVQLKTPDDYAGASMIQAGGSTSFWLMWLLIGILMAEQVLAFSASYHPAKQETA